MFTLNFDPVLQDQLSADLYSFTSKEGDYARYYVMVSSSDKNLLQMCVHVVLLQKGSACLYLPSPVTGGPGGLPQEVSGGSGGGSADHPDAAR